MRRARLPGARPTWSDAGPLGAEELARALSGPRLLAAPARPDDAAPLQACLEGAPGYFAETEGGPAGPAAALALLGEAEADAQRRLLLFRARPSGPVLGLLDLLVDYPEPRVAHVALLLLREACQGRGLGREAVHALESALRAGDCRALRLSVVDESPGARAFWERMGFAAVGRLERGVTVFEKPLAPSRRLP
jgi:GNAT superfamily N-acetyltransferase